MLVLVWNVLQIGRVFTDPGVDCYTKRNPEKASPGGNPRRPATRWSPRRTAAFW
jgi:hypothetical protein